MAHSYEVGFVVHFTTAGQNGLLKNAVAHHNWEIGVNAGYSFAKLVFKRMVLIENQNSLLLFMLAGIKTGMYEIQDSLIIGEHAASRNCDDIHEKKSANKTGIVSAIQAL